jgi:hypothetical protein
MSAGYKKCLRKIVLFPRDFCPCITTVAAGKHLEEGQLLLEEK